jgi:DNA-binding MarR family transcriptional regulator
VSGSLCRVISYSPKKRRLLARHQNVLEKLRKEIEAVVGVGPEARHPDRTDLKKMMYLTYVVKEGWSSHSRLMVDTSADSR